MAEKQKGNGPGVVAPYTKQPGSGKGSNFPKSGDANTKGWSEKVGGHGTKNAPKK